MEAIAGCYPKGEACKRSQTPVILHECHHTDLGPVAAGTAAVWDNTAAWETLAVAWEISVIIFPKVSSV